LANFFGGGGAGVEAGGASESDWSVAYFAGAAVNLCMQAGEQKKYVVPWYCALPRACSDSRVMPQTGSFEEKSRAMLCMGTSGSLISPLSRPAISLFTNCAVLYS